MLGSLILTFAMLFPQEYLDIVTARYSCSVTMSAPVCVENSEGTTCSSAQIMRCPYSALHGLWAPDNKLIQHEAGVGPYEPY